MKISYALLVSALACVAYAAPVEAGEPLFLPSLPLLLRLGFRHRVEPRLTSDVLGPCDTDIQENALEERQYGDGGYGGGYRPGTSSFLSDCEA